MALNEKLGTGENVTTALKRVVYQCAECGVEVNIETDDHSTKMVGSNTVVWCKKHIFTKRKLKV